MVARFVQLAATSCDHESDSFENAGKKVIPCNVICGRNPCIVRVHMILLSTKNYANRPPEARREWNYLSVKREFCESRSSIIRLVNCWLGFVQVEDKIRFVSKLLAKSIQSLSKFFPQFSTVPGFDLKFV